MILHRKCVVTTLEKDVTGGQLGVKRRTNIVREAFAIRMVNPNPLTNGVLNVNLDQNVWP